MSAEKINILFLNAKFGEYCKMNKIDLSEVEREKAELFTSAWFAGFQDGYVCKQIEEKNNGRQ